MYDARFKGMSAEEIYAIRQKEPEKKPGKRSARGEITDAPGGEAGKEKAEMEAMTLVRSAYAMAKKHIGAGTLPADILAIVKDLDEPKVDWRRKLRNFAEDSAIRETDWRRPSKRSPFPIILPGKTSSAPAKAVIGLDWSGSTWGPPRQAFGGEIQAMLDERAVGEIVCVFFDTEVKKVERYEPGDVISLESTGNGGTAFGPTLKWIAENEPDASCIIFLTDLGGTDNQQIEPPGPPVMWCRVPGLRVTPPRFGEIIELDPHG
jgi:predicted metal-dependent peptidase